MGMNTHHPLVGVAAHAGVDCSDRYHSRSTLTKIPGNERVVNRPASLVVGLQSQYKFDDEWLNTHRFLVGDFEMGDVV